MLFVLDQLKLNYNPAKITFFGNPLAKKGNNSLSYNFPKMQISFQCSQSVYY